MCYRNADITFTYQVGELPHPAAPKPPKRRCPYCGKQIESKNGSCPWCGSKLNYR